MAVAAELRPGMAVRLDGAAWKVVAVDVRAGTGKMKGAVHARLLNLETRHCTDRRFRLDEKVEDSMIAVRSLGYLYRDGDSYVFMDRESFEQYPLPGELLGPFLPFLREDQDLQIEFLEGHPVGCRPPEHVELEVASTGPVQHLAESNVWKEAVLENGLSIQVPLFIASGEKVRVDVHTQKYLERVRP